MACVSGLSPAGATSAGLACPWRGRQRSASPPPRPFECIVPTSRAAATTSRRHFPAARAEQTCPNTPPPRAVCPLTPSVVAPWLQAGPAGRELVKSAKMKELAGSTFSLGQSEEHFTSLEEKDVQRHMQMFGVLNLDMMGHKGGRTLRHSASLPPEVFGASPQAKVPAAPVRTARRQPVQADKVQAQQSGKLRPCQAVRTFPKANHARLTGPALRAMADMEADEKIEVSVLPPRRVSFQPFQPLQRILVTSPDQTKTSAQSLTTAASYQASQASLASTGSLQEASPASLFTADFSPA
mmetsp:Transcript_31223/g.72197  ORF Transcript_31223/g.72197 Transcript_31223/m.72197 type:complete len:297 (+) Transcript_31223:73-963(+)